jgi:hypothetical protein
MSETTEKIFQAFASSPHRWRTARAIAKQTGISITEVTSALERSPEIIKARKGNQRGEALFARKEKRSAEAPHHRPEEQHVPDEEDRPTRFTYLILLPFDPSAKQLRDTIGSIIRQEQGEPIFLDEIRTGAVWVDEVLRLIRASDAVIADLTRLNPNVMFELGMAHGLGKPLVLLLSETTNSSLPSDLVGNQYLTYAPENLSAFSDRLSRKVRQLAQRRGAL